MIGVAQVFGIKLPVAEHALALVAEHFDRLVEETRNLFDEKRVEKLGQRLCFLRESAEDHPAQHLDAQLREPVACRVEILG